MAESNLLIKGEELEVKNEFPATGKKSIKERLLYGNSKLFAD